MRLRRKRLTLRFGLSVMMSVLVVQGARTQSTSGTRIRVQKFSDSSSQPVFQIRDNAYLIAYQDVVRILKAKNDCSDFFGGPDAVRAFNELAAEMRKRYSDDECAIRMYGPQTTVQNGDSSVHYRLFEQAEINGRGSFFHVNLLGQSPKTPSVGRFSPNTREARMLMLLHELGHLIEVAPGQWLLPNDGNDPSQSQDNTWTVVKHCDESIRSVMQK